MSSIQDLPTLAEKITVQPYKVSSKKEYIKSLIAIPSLIVKEKKGPNYRPKYYT